MWSGRGPQKTNPLDWWGNITKCHVCVGADCLLQEGTGEADDGRFWERRRAGQAARSSATEDNVMDCPVCLTAYDDKVQRPRNLPCGHTFCTLCVNGLIKQGQVACPNCRVVHAVPQAGQFPISYDFENLLMMMSGASLASPPPSAETDTAESAHSLGTRPGQQGLSKRVRSLLEEQEAKILAAIHNCQKVKAQLNQYEATVRDWGRQQQDLEDRLQSLVDQCKDARMLARQEELSASDKRQQVDQGEQQLHTVLQAVRTAASAVEAYETIEDADHVMEEETQREEECLAIIPDVHTVTTIKKATEVSQAALEAAATVQAAQQTAGVGGGAAGDASLPTAAASSIKGRVDALMSATLKTDDRHRTRGKENAGIQKANKRGRSKRGTSRRGTSRRGDEQEKEEQKREEQEKEEQRGGEQERDEQEKEQQKREEQERDEQEKEEQEREEQERDEQEKEKQERDEQERDEQERRSRRGTSRREEEQERDDQWGASREGEQKGREGSSLHPAPLSLQAEDLRSLTQPARDLLQRELVFAVHTTEGRSRQAIISHEDDRLYLHCLRDQPLPRGAVTLQVGAALLPDLDKGVYGESWMAGDVWGSWGDPAVDAQFIIITKDWPGHSVPYVLGKVEGGLEVVVEAARHRPITEVSVVDCGVVVD
ncbi:Reticulocyte-binding protein 2 a [Chionoecetes opilio]|uniref:Reticulocyte-binding protein 2 a n=1 Tax=Chionoecetes opilio TaxID=41210 RepID=A0A8J4YJU5_CHIOP|nr:Reticulocyte-binding protein 2 a [Chionoecetes opilio]